MDNQEAQEMGRVGGGLRAWSLANLGQLAMVVLMRRCGPVLQMLARRGSEYVLLIRVSSRSGA